MTIQLQFVLGSDFSSQAIAWFSQGHLSHVDAIMRDGQLLGARDDEAGGQPPGVRIRPAGYAKFKQRLLMTIPANAEQDGRFYSFLWDQLGKPYDPSAIWGFVTGRNWREPDSWICSELVTAAGEAAGILPRLYLAANKITPVACALAYSAAGGIA
jgi:hypothetical protein